MGAKGEGRRRSGIYLKENWISLVAHKLNSVVLNLCHILPFRLPGCSPHPWSWCRIKQPKDWDISKQTEDHNKVSRRPFIGWVEYTFRWGTWEWVHGSHKKECMTYSVGKVYPVQHGNTEHHAVRPDWVHKGRHWCWSSSWPGDKQNAPKRIIWFAVAVDFLCYQIIIGLNIGNLIKNPFL